MNLKARWPRVKALFHEALDQRDDVRDAWLARQCGDDKDLYDDVARLLAERGRHSDTIEGGVQGLLGRLTPDIDAADVDKNWSDSNDNSTDFVAVAPTNPRNVSSPCAATNEIYADGFEVTP